jgi:hypothetical protein
MNDLEILSQLASDMKIAFQGIPILSVKKILSSSIFFRWQWFKLFEGKHSFFVSDQRR